ncbi:MAG: tRNA pseudouridine(54/55) synthase Pus10, partial [Candidatus ainarchaeum sp.]|nr:tRNA pseudouridine(54/55) synthase Pus10 [Candidatus ainarchaeum sp.]
FERELEKEDIKKIENFTDTEIIQKTPNRVKHRRADIKRTRRIIKSRVIEFNKNIAKIELTTEPGTYIKELISGDEGRTKPNLSEELKTNAKCSKLTVTGIYDNFLDSIM